MYFPLYHVSSPPELKGHRADWSSLDALTAATATAFNPRDTRENQVVKKTQ